VTSPPYYGLRSYVADGHDDKHLEIGTEETPEQYVAKLVEVFREVRRVLHSTGTCWINLGDSYNGSGGAGGDYGPGGLKEGQPKYPGRRVDGLKPKDLIGIPWMVAFALRADGWYLRSEVIWHKKAPMPESVTDRPTKAHEQLFLLSKNAQYFYDAEAIKEPSADLEGSKARYQSSFGGKKSEHLLATNQVHTRPIGMREFDGTRNKRSVWTLGPESYSGAHFAVMPSKLVEPCILAGTSAHGCCSACGAPWERVTERTITGRGKTASALEDGMNERSSAKSLAQKRQAYRAMGLEGPPPPVTTGWTATCTCNADVVPCAVLDPFLGSGTTLAVALKHGRRGIGLELNQDYISLAHDRISKSQPVLFALEPAL
jgi:DNA modification methylase